MQYVQSLFMKRQFLNFPKKPEMLLKTFLYLIIYFLILNQNIFSEEFDAFVAVETREVYEGESFVYQIRVSGSEDPEKPDLSGLKDFTVWYGGRTESSSSSVSIVNGKISREVKRTFSFNFRLTPKKTGNFVIPPVEVKSDGKVIRTAPVSIIVKEPEEMEGFRLEQTMSRDSCYVGEPVILTVKWFIGKDIQDDGISFNLPVTGDKRFICITPQIDPGSTQKFFRFGLGQETALGTVSQETLAGERYTTLTFKRVLIPEEPGLIAIDKATVSCSMLSGYANRKSRDSFSLFDDDFFGSSRRAVYKKAVIPSNAPYLNVKALPQGGKPRGFSGHIGEYSIETSASPLKVNVGDPVTLTITVSGPEYLEHVELPSLSSQPDFSSNFKIPDERASAEIKGKTKVFTQTIRPMNSDIKEIPPVRLPYFDTGKGKYSIAESKPIPVTVDETKIVTLLDAEGASNIPVTGSDIETWGKGIAFNYEDMSVLEKKYLTPLSGFKEDMRVLFIFLPPVFYFILLITVSLYRKKYSDPLRILSKKAYGTLKKDLKSMKNESPDRLCELVLDSMRHYLGARLRMPSGKAITFSDVRQKLDSYDIDKDITERLKALFESCEAGRYAGSITFDSNTSLIEEGINIAEYLEKRIR